MCKQSGIDFGSSDMHAPGAWALVLIAYGVLGWAFYVLANP